MTALTIRLPDSIHRKVKELAARDGISVNQFIASAARHGGGAACTSQALCRHFAGASQAGLPAMQAGRAPAASVLAYQR